MITVRIIKDWDYPDLFRQTPGDRGIWEGIKFTTHEIDTCDYLMVLNYSPKKIKVNCPPENVWCILQEPPNEYFKPYHKADKVYSLIFTQDESLKGERFIQSQPALPWHINKSYDRLISLKIPLKTKKLSWITTNKSNFQGHRERMIFLEKLKKEVKFDLFGRGFREISDKWEGLAPYKYSLAIENYSCRNYWTEKLADCFLSYSVPIYYGCTNLKDYFPEESYIQIDIKDKLSPEYINKVITRDMWKKRLPALIKARELVLNKYQFFPFMAEKIREWENKGKSHGKEQIVIPKGNTFLYRLKNKILG